MKSEAPTLAKNPTLRAGLDFFRLRAEAIACIAELGSRQWTDYNTHDPGITLLESLLFAINDLTYRAQWNVADLLAGASAQPFFTARTILTVNPVTPDDYRRLLIDLEPVRNAWIVCKECGCGEAIAKVRGLYEVNLELESDEIVGDLNDRVVEGELRVGGGDELHEVVVEARFPRVDLLDKARFDEWLAEETQVTAVECVRLQKVKTSDSTVSGVLPDDEMRKAWRNVFYATLRLDWATGSLTIHDVSLRFFTTAAGKNELRAADLVGLLQHVDDTAIVSLYRKKERLTHEAVNEARKAYHAHRNLDEDLCRIDVVSVGQVAVCADIEVATDADLEGIQARAWLAIEDYLAPAVPFYRLAEMRELGVPVEEIFAGPVLENGFILQDDLEAAGLRGVVCASDIIDRLMDIEGVRSVSSLLLTRYDDEGNTVRGVVDPSFQNGKPIFDPKKLSASWLLYMGKGQQPRLYHRLSNFKFRKNGLPFTINEAEAYATLTQLRGERERPKCRGERGDLPIPQGIARGAANISPVQYLLPLVYGVSAEGLLEGAGATRKAQALQLKAYLMVFEQLLGNAFEQVAHLGDLFSMSPDVESTYFPHDFSGEIDGYEAVVDVTKLDAARLQRLCEPVSEFLERRNRFLDHVMSRFGLSFADYALLLTNFKGEAAAERELIADKLNVLAAYPEISSGRALAFNHRAEPGLPPGGTVLERRIALLLGYADLRLELRSSEFSLLDRRGEVWAHGDAPSTPAVRATLEWMSRPSSYVLRAAADGYRLVVRDGANAEVAEASQRFTSVTEAVKFRDELSATVSILRGIVVEHLLLRPKFPGDAVYRECSDCEDADPWSFRLTVVMPGWISPYNDDLDWRDFANRTIQEEVPSHLLPKICWVGDDGYEADPCLPVVDGLTKAIRKGAHAECEQAVPCAVAVYQAHVQAFQAWYAGKERQILDRDAAKLAVSELFLGVAAGDVDCGLDLSPLWSELQRLLVAHFSDVVVQGYQFSRFEEAWYAWLEEDRNFDWGEERLADRLQAMLRHRLLGSTTTDLCACAAAILESCGAVFAAWMKENLDQRREPGEFTPPAVELCADASFVDGTAEELQGFLAAKYASYVPVGYRLALLLRQLESLTNTYPTATLHDCEEGGDDNPVRLNRTALGSLSMGDSERAPLVVEPESEQPPPVEPESVPRRLFKKRPTKRKR